MWYFSSSVWVTSLSMIISGSIHGAAKVITSLFLMAMWKPGMLQSMGSQSWTRLSDWTELNGQITPPVLFFFFRCMTCRILVPWPGIELMPPAVEAWNPIHWTVREVLEQPHFWLFGMPFPLLVLGDYIFFNEVYVSNLSPCRLGEDNTILTSNVKNVAEA